ncbi:MAG: terminase TerL endonuclease subunit [Janthinobacterium sp.]|jgi:phage terminase large subunit-like protein
MQTYSTEEIEQLHPTHKYAVEIVMGIRISGEFEKLACQRHLNDLLRQGTESFPYVFDETRADRISQWFERCCRHVKGVYSGHLIQLVPHQYFDFGCLFGWVHIKTGRRRFKKSYKQVGRGNAKSAEMSGLANFGLCGDCYYPPGNPNLRVYENNPQVECAAVDKEQAKIVWNDAKSMGLASPDIKRRLNIKKTYIEHKQRGGYIRPLSKDTKNKDGLSPCIVVIDEYHAHPTSEIHDVAYSGFGKRAQNLMCIITTAGKDAENNPCKKEYDICVKILKGEITDEHYFVIIRQPDKGDSPHDLNIAIKKANPMLQVENEYAQYLLEQIQDEHDKAYNSGDYAKIREYLTKRCNLWQMDSEQKYLDGLMDKYKSLAIPRDEFLERVRGKECYSGVDLSKRIDLTGNGYVFPLENGFYAVTAHGWLPQDKVQWHKDNDHMDYEFLQRDGWCTIQEGGVIDTDGIIEYSEKQVAEQGWKIKEWDLDPATAYQFATDLKKHNYADDQVLDIRQGPLTLSEPTKFFRELIIKGKLIHDGSPLLTWCASNAMEVDKGGGLIMLSKKHKDDTQRIDLLAAIITAMRRAMVVENAASVYERRGMRIL